MQCRCASQQHTSQEGLYISIKLKPVHITGEDAKMYMEDAKTGSIVEGFTLE